MKGFLENWKFELRWFLIDWGVPLIGVAVSAAIIGGLVWLIVVVRAEENRQWDAFSAAHNCVVVEKRDGYTSSGTGFTSNGKTAFVTTSTPAQVAYRCDDGITYWKNER